MPRRTRDALVLAALLVAVVVLGGPKFRNPQFHAEDALILYRQAFDDGLASLLKPYAGYLLTFDRLVALPGILLRDPFVPAWYVGVSGIALLIASWIAYRRISASGFLLGAVAAVVMLLSPSRHEVQFTLTNAQWILAAACLLVLADPAPPKSPWLTFLGVFLVGVSGPFSIVFTPVLIVRYLLLRDVPRSLPLYAATVLSAAVQLYFLATSPRQHYGPERTAQVGSFAEAILRNHPSHVVGPSASGLLSAAWFWATLLLILVILWRKRRESSAVFAFLMLVGGSMVYASSLYVFRFDPTAISPNAVIYSIPLGGERYFYIPTLAFLIAALLAADGAAKPVRVYLVGSVAVVLVAGLPFLWKYPREDLHWGAYAALAPFEPEVKAPIFHGLLLDRLGPRRPRPIRIPLADVPVQLAGLEVDGRTWRATSDDPIAAFALPDACGSYPYVAFAVEGGGFAHPQVYLGKGKTPAFTERQSLAIAHQGDGTLYFAFRKQKDQEYQMRFDIDNRRGTFDVRRAEIICY